MPTSLLETRAPFNAIFPIQDAVLKKLIARMEKIGFDPAHPIIVWMCDKPVVLDGHTRLQAALKLGIDEVTIISKEFGDAGDALDYAVSQQVERRNLTPGDMLRYITAADKLVERGRKKLAPIGANSKGKSSAKLAEVLHVSPRQAERLRKIAKEGSAETQQAVSDGSMSIHQAYEQTRKENPQNPEKGESNEFSSPEEKEQWIRDSRMEALVGSVEVWLKNRLDHEKREYPDVRYAPSDLKKLLNRITRFTEKQLNDFANN